MLKAILDHIPSFQVLLGAVASIAIPIFFTWLNKVVREWGNPPWMQKQKGDQRSSQQNQQKQSSAQQSSGVQQSKPRQKQ